MIFTLFVIAELVENTKMPEKNHSVKQPILSDKLFLFEQGALFL